MYTVTKRMEIAGSHQLTLPYESKCENLHGHNWIITVTCQSERLSDYGMVMDFTAIKQLIHDKLDHKNLNQVFDFNPTAENIAEWVCDTLNYNFLSIEAPERPKCVKVEVQESEGNCAIFEQ